QVRADYAGSDIDRKWGVRRSAPRDYLFERPVVLGKLRMGPDLSNIGKRAPVEEENAAPAASPTPTGPTTPQASPATNQAPGASPPTPPSSATPASPAGGPSPPASTAKVAEATTPAQASTSPTAIGASPTPAVNAATTADSSAAASGTPLPYGAAWHHRHLY